MPRLARDGRRFRFEPRSRLRRLVVAAGVLVGSALYFLVGATAGVQLTDEGMIVYSSWLVTQGEMPHRDFQQVYGPSLFFLNGALLARFGSDLFVIRLSLVAIKALLALLVYALSRQLASCFAALLVTAVYVAIWGTPIWVFNTPYANHYGLPLSLGGLLVYCSLPAPPRARLLLAGLCIGLAATFKQTLGIFFALAVAFGLTFRQPLEDSSAVPWSARGDWIMRGMMLLAVVAALALYVGYMQANLTSWSTLVLLTPAVAGLGMMALAEVTGGRSPQGRLQHLQEMVWFGGGVAIPLVAYAGFFHSRGLLRELVRNMLYGLPQQLEWFVPLPVPLPRTVILAAAMVSCFGWVSWWNGQHRRPASPVAGVAWSAASVLSVGGVVGILWGTSWRHYFGDGGWTQDVARLIWWAPLAVVLALIPSVFRCALAAHGETGRMDRRGTLTVVWFFGAAAILQLYPGADLPHVAMVLPACLPLVAYSVDSFRGSAASRGRSYVSSALVVAAVLGVVVPAARLLTAYATSRPADAPGFRRASHIWASDETFSSAVALAEFLQSEVHHPQGMFLIAHEPLLYFLTGINSPLQQDEFVLYLVGSGILPGEKARTLVDQDRVIQRLEAVAPLIVDKPGSPLGERFREAFPAVAKYLATRYRPAERVGSYTVLRRSDGTDRPSQRGAMPATQTVPLVMPAKAGIQAGKARAGKLGFPLSRLSIFSTST